LLKASEEISHIVIYVLLQVYAQNKEALKTMDRAFDPEQEGWSKSTDPSDVVSFDGEVSRLYPSGRRSKTPLVLWIDGACRGNGTDTAYAEYGVYFGGDKSPWNSCAALPDNTRHTS
jgi:hypothetical protein